MCVGSVRTCLGSRVELLGYVVREAISIFFLQLVQPPLAAALAMQMRRQEFFIRSFLCAT